MTSHLGKPISGYSPGEIQEQGCVTIEIGVAGGGVPLQIFIDTQYLDSKTMDKRPGMFIKYLPYLYNEVTGKLLAGGAYLFGTYEYAKDYLRWAGEDYEVGEPKVKFAEQPLFESFVGTSWKVIGAHSFLPIDQHSVARLMKWKCGGAAAAGGIEEKLRELYPKLRAAAEQHGVASVWLLHNPDTNTVGLETGFRKIGETDAAGAAQTLNSAKNLTALGDVLTGGLDVEPIFDRTSVLLTLWLPKSRAEGGAELTIPYYPLVPDITHEHN
jgi:hypothetical protein